MLDILRPLWDFFVRHAYVVTFIVSAIDATGFPFPGRVLLVGAGALAAAGNASLMLVILAATGGAVLGDHLWYVLGRWRGRAIVTVGCKVAVRSPDCVDRATALLERFGVLAIVFGRFFAAVRIFVTTVAAGTGMPYYKYLLSDAVGALIWSALFIVLGYSAAGYGQTTVLIVGIGAGLVAFGGALCYRLFTRAGRPSLDASASAGGR